MTAITKLQDSLWRLSIPLYAAKLSQGRYIPYDYLMQIATEVQTRLMQRNARIIVCMPPRRGKTVTLTEWTPTWWIDTFPSEDMMITSCEATAATTWSRTVRDNIRTNPYAMTTIRQDVAAAKLWKTVHGGSCLAAGVGGRIIGSGFYLGILDDPYKNWVQAYSPAWNSMLFDWFDSTFYSRLEPNGSIMVVTTRWHAKDLVNYLMSSHRDDWTLLSYPLLAEKNDALGRKPGETFLTGRYTQASVDRLKQVVPPIIWAAMYQQNPLDEQGNIFYSDWWQYWSEDGRGATRRLPAGFDEVLISCDMNFKETTSGSFACYEKWGRLGPDFFLLDLVRGRWGFLDALRHLLGFLKIHPDAMSVLVEEAANGAAVIDVLRARVPGVYSWNPKGSKIVRGMAVSTFHKSGNVYIPPPDQYPWVQPFLEEHENFPKKDENNDQVDAASQALLWFNKRLRGQIFGDNAVEIPDLEKSGDLDFGLDQDYTRSNLQLLGDLCNV